MKRGLVLISIILLLAAPMASAGFFNDFFENLLDRSGSGITGYSTLPSLSTLLKTAAPSAISTARAIAPNTTSSKAVLPTSATKTPALNKTSQRTKSALANAAPNLSATPNLSKTVLSPPPSSSSSALKPAAISKVKFVKGLYKIRPDLTVSITSVGADKVANAKIEQMIADEKVININEKWYKVNILENQRIRLTPTDAPKEGSKDAAAPLTNVASPAARPSLVSANLQSLTNIQTASSTAAPTNKSALNLTRRTAAAKTVAPVNNLNPVAKLPIVSLGGLIR